MSKHSCALFAACLFLPALPAQPAAPVPSAVSIRVDDYRPLAALAFELEKRFGIVITYEEGPWMAAVDLEDVTLAVQATNPGKKAPPRPVIGPRKAAVSFEYTPGPAQGRPADFVDMLAALLVQYEAAGAPGEFRVEGGNGIYHLIPSRLRDAEGLWANASPVLSTPVSLADRERTVDDTLDEILAQLNESAPVKVGLAYVPLNLFAQKRIRLAADGVPAREVMRQILELLPRRVTWRLNYDPTTRSYYLSFPLFPDDRPTLSPKDWQGE